jgi:hypothetical protein
MVGFADARTHQRLVARFSHDPDNHSGGKRQGKKRARPPMQKLSILWYIPLIIIITSVGVLLLPVNNLLILRIDNSFRPVYMQGLWSFLFVFDIKVFEFLFLLTTQETQQTGLQILVCGHSIKAPSVILSLGSTVMSNDNSKVFLRELLSGLNEHCNGYCINQNVSLFGCISDWHLVIKAVISVFL